MVVFDRKKNKTDVELFINCLMKNGKREKAYKLFVEALVFLSGLKKKKKLIESPFETLNKAIFKLKPNLKLCPYFFKKRRYYYPGLVSEFSSRGVAIRWLIKYSKYQRESSASKRLGREIFEVSCSKNFTGGYSMGKKRNFCRVLEIARSNLYKKMRGN